MNISGGSTTLFDNPIPQTGQMILEKLPELGANLQVCPRKIACKLI
ncbi:hypothetical protein RINTHM_15220 [Richelia intracellularis HM01]|nr:hypothetical protein [Richelia intracellularis]CCH65979.1 hypothetical protein RINTHM_15220 [Richelia intracellularis HM01]